MKTTELKISDKFEKLLKSNLTTKTKVVKKRLDTSLYDKVSEKGLLEKVEYSFPVNDTLGREFYNATKFRAK